MLLMKTKMNQCVLRGFGNGYPEALCGVPTFSWHLTVQEGKQYQYRLCVKNTKEEMIWDSDWVISEQSDNVLYKGPTLQNDCDYVVQVIVEDEKGNRFESDKEYFSTGLGEDMWYAKWMRPGYLGGQAPLIRKGFLIRKEIFRAKLYICGLGYQESYINGEKVGNDLLSPTWTNIYDTKYDEHQGESASERL